MTQSLKGLTVNYVAGAAVEHTIIDPFFAQFTKETGITVNENLTTACVGTIGGTMFMPWATSTMSSTQER